jgi:hypothetical protein
MKLNRSIVIRVEVLISLMASLTLLSSHLQADTGNCGGATTTLPFTDVMGNPFFYQIAAADFSGLTNGTTATPYSPSQTVTREQMAAFITRSMDQSLKRGSQRAVAKKWWTPQDADCQTLTNVGDHPQLVEFDGTDVWVASFNSANVTRIRPGDGKVLDTWTGATNAVGIVCAMGGFSSPDNRFRVLTVYFIAGFCLSSFDSKMIMCRFWQFDAEQHFEEFKALLFGQQVR